MYTFFSVRFKSSVYCACTLLSCLV